MQDRIQVTSRPGCRSWKRCLANHVVHLIGMIAIQIVVLTPAVVCANPGDLSHSVTPVETDVLWTLLGDQQLLGVESLRPLLVQYLDAVEIGRQAALVGSTGSELLVVGRNKSTPSLDAVRDRHGEPDEVIADDRITVQAGVDIDGKIILREDSFITYRYGSLRLHANPKSNRIHWLSFPVEAGVQAVDNDSDAVPWLNGGMSNLDLVQRFQVVTELGNLNRQTALSVLLKSLEDREPLVARAACISLGTLGNKEAAKSLIALLRDDQLGVCAAWSLVQLGAQEAVPELASIVNTIALRHGAVPRDSRHLSFKVSQYGEAMGQLGGSKASETLLAILDAGRAPPWIFGALESIDGIENQLIRRLESNDRKVRELAARALGGFHDDSVMVALGSAQKDDAKRVRRAATESLTRINSSLKQHTVDSSGVTLSGVCFPGSVAELSYCVCTLPLNRESERLKGLPCSSFVFVLSG